MNAAILSLILVLLPVQQDNLPGSWIGRFKLAEEALEEEAFDEAIELLNSCFELALNNATTAYHLACAHARAGRRDEALSWLEQAVDWGWIDADIIRWDEDFVPLRDSEKFEELARRAATTKDAPGQSIRLVEPFWELLSSELQSISADGERLLANNSLWDIRTGELIAMLSDGEEKVDQSFFSPSGEYIATISESSVRIWNGKDGRFVQKRTDIVVPGIIGFAEDGLLLFHGEHQQGNQSGSPNQVLSRVSIPIGEQRSGHYEGSFHPVLRSYSISHRWNRWAVSPGGKRVITYPFGGPSVQLWDGETGELISSYPIFGIWEVGFSQDGSQAYILATTERVPLYKAKMGIHWLDADDGSVLRHLKFKEDPRIQDCIFDSDGTLVSVHSSGLIRWWSAHEDAPVRQMQISPVGVVDIQDLGLRLSRDGKRLAVYSGYSHPSLPFCLLDLATGELIREWPENKYGACFSGEYCIISESPSYSFWGGGSWGAGSSFEEIVRNDDGQTVQRFENSRLLLGWPRILNDDATVLVPAGDGTIRAFELETGKTKWILYGHLDKITDIRFTRDGTIAASTSIDGTVRIWDLKKKKETAVFLVVNPKDRLAAEARFDPAGNRIATYLDAYNDYYASEYHAKVWSIETGEELFEIPLYDGIHDLAWSPEGNLIATAHEDGTARVWDAFDGSPTGSPIRHPDSVYAVAFEPGGKQIATGRYWTDLDFGMAGKPAIQLWDVASGKLTAELPLSGDFWSRCYVPLLVWTSEGNLIATTYKWATVECFDCRTSTTRWINGFLGGVPVTLYALPNAKGTRVYVSGMRSENAVVLDARTGEVLKTLGTDESNRGHWNLSGTEDDRYFISKHEDGATVVFDGHTFTERYRRIEYVNGEALLVAPTLAHQGSVSVIQKTYIKREGVVFPLDSFAPVLYDPKRFSAAAAGMSLRQMEHPSIPRLLSILPDKRTVNVSEDRDQFTISAEAECDDGILSFQLEMDGRMLPLEPAGVEIRKKEQNATMTWVLARPATGETELRIRAISRSGVLSKPELVTLKWQ